MSRRLGAAAALIALFGAWSAGAADGVRPTDAGGYGGFDYGSATVQSFGNSSVLVWYTTTGTNAVDPTSTRSDSVPDDVATVATVTADALAEYATMGFAVPVSDATNPACGSNGGDGRLDVYLFAMNGADGETVAESGRCAAGGGTATVCASFIIAQSKLAVYYTTAEVGIRTVLPHESFHVVQNAYDANLDRFWAEGTAQWAAKTLDPSLTDLERFLPSFFQQTSRALDGPANGVTASFLYGAAIWPVFLTQRFGDDIVRAILDQEGQTGGSALAATDVVLQSMQTSMAVEYPLFSSWNAATGTRAGSGGYTSAATYPMVTVAELGTTVSGTNSGFASYFYHASASSASGVTLDPGMPRNAGILLPLDGGVARLDESATLPANVTGEGIVVVSGTSDDKSDAPFTVTLGPAIMTPSGKMSHGGCTFAPHAASPGALGLGLGFALVALFSARRRAIE